MDLGDKLRNLRKNLNKTQTEVAKDLKITPQAYSQYERNVRIPDIDMIKKLSDYYCVSSDYLLGRMNSNKFCISNNLDNIYNNIITDLSQLPEQAVYEIADYIDFIKQRYNPKTKTQNKNSSIHSENAKNVNKNNRS